MISCRFCGQTRLHEFIDLGHMPSSNSFLTKEQLDEPETYYPLILYVCDSCWLVQLPESKKATEIFKDDYPYYSSHSPANVSHAKEYVEMIMDRFHPENIIEIGSNDGYLLQYFPKSPTVLGIDPVYGPVLKAREKGIGCTVGFFSSKLAKTLVWQADLICGINVLAHQPDINDFAEGLRIALKPNGIITMEFPHLMHLIDKCQFDTIYHEHYSYFSFMAICEIFARHELIIFDVDQIPEHGGSLRIYAQHGEGPQTKFEKVNDLLLEEYNKGMGGIHYYQNFQSKVDIIKTQLVRFLIIAKMEGYSVAAYGAAAKGSTLFNYCGLRSDLIDFVVDRSPYKQGKFMPGSHIPVVNEDHLKKMQPKYILIAAWNIKEEIMEQLKYIREWDGKFIIPIPELEII